jgi:hypothetical protein
MLLEKYTHIYESSWVHKKQISRVDLKLASGV